MKINNEIPIFFAVDDQYMPYLDVALISLIENASKDYHYVINVINIGLSPSKMKKIKAHENENFKIYFVDASDYIGNIHNKLKNVYYFSLAAYYRLFIQGMFPEYKKVIYLDCDIIVKGDISKLYNTRIGTNLIGAVVEKFVASTPEFRNYAQQAIGVDPDKYVNSGILIMNLEQFRWNKIEEKFTFLLDTYNFEMLDPDQGYLNYLCKNRIAYLSNGWNYTNAYDKLDDELNIIHYALSVKPWQSKVRYDEEFWNYAKKSVFYEDIKAVKEKFTEEDKQKKIDSDKEFLKRATKLAESNFSLQKTLGDYFTRSKMNRLMKLQDREDILKKINNFEYEKKFDVDVEDDPPSKVLMPNKIDYLRKKPSSKLKRDFAYAVARKFMNKLLKNKQLIIKEVNGIENWQNVKVGAIVTCNHFNAMDSFAMQYTYDKAGFNPKKRKLYKVIREGNYTNFGGFYGFLMRNCNTLPLSSNAETMKKFVKAIDKILGKKEFILIYPEQSMWWNYKKPRPLKKGAYNFAARNNVPIVPIFITMKDSDVIGEDGYPIQEYTINVFPAIYPDENLPKNTNIDNMMQKNFELWKDCYEKTYGIPLTYNTKDDNKE